MWIAVHEAMLDETRSEKANHKTDWTKKKRET